jgi:hypothetical protein
MKFYNYLGRVGYVFHQGLVGLSIENKGRRANLQEDD